MVIAVDIVSRKSMSALSRQIISSSKLLSLIGYMFGYIFKPMLGANEVKILMPIRYFHGCICAHTHVRLHKHTHTPTHLHAHTHSQANSNIHEHTHTCLNRIRILHTFKVPLESETKGTSLLTSAELID